MSELPEGFDTAHLPYIGKVAAAMTALGLDVQPEDIEPWDRTDECRAAVITIGRKTGDGPMDHKPVCAVWDERDGWFAGYEEDGGGLINWIEYYGGPDVADPAEIAKAVADFIAGHHAEWSRQGFARRDADEIDPEFEAELAEYKDETSRGDS